jgi:hypothetical protein
MLAYLHPVVLVDGQHRLAGAVAAAKSTLDTDDADQLLLDAYEAGEDPDASRVRLLRERSPRLPVSLLMDGSPSEHVFQFVVVNQKATPMGKALLGTIVSTSLGRDEIRPVADRLTAAGIRLEDSQAVAYLTRADESPFQGLVQTGISGDNPKHIQWPVLQGIVKIFRELHGGKLYGFSLDYANMWKRDFLPDSNLVQNTVDPDMGFKQWSQPDGPWRDVFIRFFSIIRDRFGDPADMEAYNSWGNTHKNLFNKVSLTILSADYFEYLHTRRETLDAIDNVDRTVDDWLAGVNVTYFNRPWPMENLKKDTATVREKWAKLWWEYRKNPQAGLPKVTQYKTR